MHLRELLTRYLAPVVAAMRARQGMAVLLRLNRVVDQGVAAAVVGYTDALVAAMLRQSGVPDPGRELDPDELERQLEALEGELAGLVRRV